MRDNQAAGFTHSLAGLLGRVFRQQHRRFSQAAAEQGLTTLHANILIVLWSLGPVRIGTLQHTLALSSATFTGAIDRMEKAGLVQRAKDPDDRRATLIEPAAWPAKKRRAVLAGLQRQEDECFAALTTKERATLARLLGKVTAALETEDTSST